MTTAQEWIENVRGLDAETVSRLGVKAGPSRLFSGEEAVGVPYVQNGEVKAYKVRRVGPRQDHDRPFDWSPRGVSVTLWNVDCLSDKTLAEQPLIITEGEFDAMACIEAGFPRTVSVPHGASSGATYVFDHADQMTGRVIIAGDNDPDGVAFVRAAAAALDREVRYVEWPDGCKDANDTLAKHGSGALASCIHSAKIVHPEDPLGGMITGFSDAPPAPQGRIYKTGDPVADSVCAFHEGFPTIVTGAPGMGKSTWLTWALWSAIRNHSIRVGVCMMETPWTVLLDHLTRMEKGGRQFAELSPSEREALMEKLDRDWRLLNRKDDDNVASNLWWVREMMRTAAVRDGCKIIAFDPWNELEHALSGNETMTDYTNNALAQIRQWAERFDVSVAIVAHPTKMQREAGGRTYAPTGYDIAGSAAWANKAAIGLTVHRAEDDNGEFNKIINWKSKFEALYSIQRNRVASMDMDPRTMVFRRRMH